MPFEVAQGEVSVSLNDRDVRSGLHRLEAEYAATMAKIDRMEAEATVDIDTERLDAKYKSVQDKLKILKAERANIKMGADTSEIDRKIVVVERQLKRIDGRRAEIEIGTRGEREALATLETVRKAEAARAAANDRYQQQRERYLLNEVKQAEKRQQIARQEELNAVKAEQRIAGLRREYARLDGELDKLNTKFDKQSRSFGGVSREQKLRFDIDDRFLKTRMETIKKELDFLGGHPPVELNVRFDERTLRARFVNFVQGLARRGDTRINLGPITTSVRTLVVAGTALSSVLTSIIGSATALVGVLGTGLAGAAASASGIIGGLVLNMGGLVATLVPAVKNFKLATAATKAHDQAVAKYGKDSKQAVTAQRQLNSVIAQLDPNSRQALRGLNSLRSGWEKLTGQTAQRNVGKVLKGGIDALRNLMPILARNTNESSNILTRTLTRWEAAAGSRSGQSIFGSLGRSANKFLRDALPGIDHLGAAFAHIAESAARLFAGPAGSGFTKWAADIDKATQPGQRLDTQITRLRDHATDLMHFFGALGRIIITVLNGGANAGDNMVQHMTRALDKWNAFLHTETGQAHMLKFFSDSEKNTRALFNALTPLVALFVRFSQIFQPLTTGALRALDIIGRIAVVLGSFAPLRKTLEGIGAAFATWVVLRKVAGYAQAIGGALRRIGSGGGLFGGNIESQMITGGRAAGEEIASAMVAAGRVVAGEVAGGEAGGGVVAGAEGAAAGAAAGRAGILKRLLGLGSGGGAVRITPAGLIVPVIFAATVTQGANKLAGGDYLHNQTRQLTNPTIFDKLKNLFGGGPSQGQQQLDRMTASLERLQRASDGRGLERLSAAARDAARQFPSLAKQFNQVASEAVSTGHPLAKLSNDIGFLRHHAATDMNTLARVFQSNMEIIRSTMGTNSKRGAEALSSNMRAAIGNVRALIRSGVVSTKQGMQDIDQILRQYLAEFGITGAQAKMYLQRRGPKTNVNKNQGPADVGAGARGGWQRDIAAGRRKADGGYIGMPGERGQDTEVALLGRGEAVLNRHQQGPVETALQHTYGMTLNDLFSHVQTPHYYASGGRAGGVTPAVQSAMGLLSRKFGLAVTSTTGGTHAPGSYHYLGEAADLAGPAATMYRAAQWIKSSGMARRLAEGIHNPNLSIKNGRPVGSGFWGASTWAQHLNHIHIAIAGALGKVGGGFGIKQIKAPIVKGGGAVGALVQRGLNLGARGANQRLNAIAGSLGGGDSYDVAPAKGAYGLGALESLWVRAGGSPAVRALMAHIALAESSGNPRAHNPSGATGLWQILGALVPGNLMNPLVNARNAVAKLRTQGLGAWASSRPVWGKYLARGGFLKRYARGRPSGLKVPRTRTAKKAPTAHHHKGRNIHHIPGGALLGKQSAEFNNWVDMSNRLINIDLPSQDERYNKYQQLYDLTQETFIVTPRATADDPNPQPYIDWTAVGQRRNELNTLIYLRRATRQTEKRAIEAVRHVLAMRTLRKRLKDRLEFLKKQEAKLQGEIDQLHHDLISIHGRHSAGPRRAKQSQLDTKRLQIKKVRDEITSIKGILGNFDTTISDAEQNYNMLRGTSGEGGRASETSFDIKELQSQLNDISDASLSGQLADQTNTDTTGTGSTADQDAINAQAEQRAQVAEAGQAIAETSLAAFTGFGDIEQGGTSAFNAAGGIRGNPSGLIGPASIVNGLVGGAIVGGGSVRSAGALIAGGGGGLNAPGAGGAGGGFGGAGVAGGGAGAVIVQQTFQSLLPTDPDILRQVGQAAAGGFSYQGYTGGSTVVTGL